MNLLELGLFAVGVSAGGWNRRVYYDALGCKGNLVHGIMVWQSPNCGSSNPIVNSACEDKSTSNPLSSEGTSCETVGQSSESIYFPPSDQAGRASAYVAINQYTSGSCSGISEGFEQNTFAADGKCYSDERGSYFKATCDGQTATVSTYCKDSSCNDCSITRYDGSCQISVNGLAVKSLCINPNNLPSQTGSNSSTNSGQATPTGSQKNSVSSPDKTAIGFTLAILAALFL